MNWNLVRNIVRQALEEDIGEGDITSRLVVGPEAAATTLITCRQEAVIAGLPVAQMVFEEVCPALSFEALTEEGERVQPGAQVARVEGNARAILTAERTALNFLQRLSGIATFTAEFVRHLADPSVKILDTRKTSPLLRTLEKYAVRVGGGQNHRFGLYDGILIKDNHIAAGGGIAEAVRRARKGAPHYLRVEVEVCTPQEAEEAIAAGADVLLLDNMTTEQMAEVATFARDKVLLEASGGIGLENVGAVSKTGVHLISVGAITHSAPAIDMTLALSVEG
jgi:nicotinate-nucleotide pyrophosphorylase (carboxylating)